MILRQARDHNEWGNGLMTSIADHEMETFEQLKYYGFVQHVAADDSDWTLTSIGEDYLNEPPAPPVERKRRKQRPLNDHGQAIIDAITPDITHEQLKKQFMDGGMTLATFETSIGWLINQQYINPMGDSKYEPITWE